ncbi:hypothetical protein [Bifidobacterium tissieri]|uniref:Uncharacterized protein n=1 Tax=Bifidobacterium tissieri TaxID=1630162 RepID=A0A5M9ZMK9_9BIFI|nr:hypothetical protein [Bifidobacterium tissieri]KAA8828669.1 hypothetical protein EM849_11570 [Bifidobacterium tissieri]KAA8831612.1 hypothetical protein EMO89_02485 [Bifidobacterium tissieri]
MSVDIILYRPDIPEDIVPWKATSIEDATDDETIIRINVTYTYQQQIRDQYPQLYPKWIEQQNGAIIAQTLPGVLLRLRAEHPTLTDINHPDYDKRCSSMIHDLGTVITVAVQHPDYRVVTQS